MWLINELIPIHLNFESTISLSLSLSLSFCVCVTRYAFIFLAVSSEPRFDAFDDPVPSFFPFSLLAESSDAQDPRIKTLQRESEAPSLIYPTSWTVETKLCFVNDVTSTRLIPFRAAMMEEDALFFSRTIASSVRFKRFEGTRRDSTSLKASPSVALFSSCPRIYDAANSCSRFLIARNYSIYVNTHIRALQIGLLVRLTNHVKSNYYYIHVLARCDK